MARFNHNDFSDASVMIMSPATDPSVGLAGDLGKPGSAFSQPYHNNSTSWTPVHSAAPISTNPSSKRSRDEGSWTSDQDDNNQPPAQANAPRPISEEIYGEGMVLLNPRTGVSISAESQTGTWYEEKTESESKPLPGSQERPKMHISRKSVRLDSAAPCSLRLDGIAASVAPESPPRSSTSKPTIDDFTYALGIGWTRLALEDPDVEAAARGWARYLENHYAPHVHGAEILLKSKGLNAYLVGSREGFFLFNEDLLQGRLVGRTWESCLNNLRMHPIAFDGDYVLRAERTPGPDAGFLNASNVFKVADEDMSGRIDAGVNAQMDID